MNVEITRSELLGELIETLARGGCHVTRTAASACRVVHPLATSEQEAWLEVAFFVRAWQLGHPGVDATLTR